MELLTKRSSQVESIRCQRVLFGERDQRRKKRIVFACPCLYQQLVSSLSYVNIKPSHCRKQTRNMTGMRLSIIISTRKKIRSNIKRTGGQSLRVCWHGRLPRRRAHFSRPIPLICRHYVCCELQICLQSSHKRKTFQLRYPISLISQRL